MAAYIFFSVYANANSGQRYKTLEYGNAFFAAITIIIEYLSRSYLFSCFVCST